MGKITSKTIRDAITGASGNLGLSEADLSDLFGKEIAYGELDAEKLSMTSFIRLLDYYCLLEFDFYGDFNKEMHSRRVAKAVIDGNFKLRLTKEVKSLVREYKKSLWKSESELYGARLRWQIRINRTFGLNIKLPTYERILPFFLRKTLYRTRKRLSLYRHVLKYGNYKDFCCYHVEYDKKEECYSGYYRDLYLSNPAQQDFKVLSPLRLFRRKHS